MPSDRGVEVRIFGRTHYLKGDDPEHIRQVARMVDEKMSHIAGRMQTADDYRVAVLTALHIADQLLAERSAIESYRSQVDARSMRMLKLLDIERPAENSELSAG